MFISQTDVDNIIDSFAKEKVNWLMVAEHTRLDVDSLIAKSNEQGFVIAGGIFPMVIHDQDAYKEGIVLKKIATTQPPILVKDLHAVKTEDLPEVTDSVKSCIIMIDGLSSTVPHFLDKIYERYWNKPNYVGAGAGSLSLEQGPCIFTNEGIYPDAAVLLMSSATTSLGVKHGWEKISGPYVANKTEGNKIIELNWRPAFDVYKEVVEQYSGLTFGTASFFDIAKGFPFGIYREGQEDIVRDPISVDENGTLTCVGQVSQNTSLNVLKGEHSNLVDCAQAAANQAIEGGKSDVFVVDCISRILYLEDNFKRELDAINGVIAKKSRGGALEGVLSIGEISLGREGFLEFYNKTIVVSSFH